MFSWLAFVIWAICAPFHAHAQFFPLGVMGASTVTGCSEATAFLARTSGLNANHTNAYTNFICTLVTAGAWSKFDALYVFFTQDATTANLNLKSSSYTITPNGSPGFTADSGYIGVDASATVYLDTGFVPSTAGGQYAQDSAHVAVWSLTSGQSSASGGVVVGDGAGSGTGNTYIFPRYSSDNAFSRINGVEDVTVTSTDGTGYWVALRNGATDQRLYRNATQLGTNEGADGTLSTLSMYFLGSNAGGVGSSGGAVRLAMGSIGATLTPTDITNIYNAFNTYMTAAP